MTLQGFDLSTLPARKGRASGINPEEANAALAIIQANGGGSDGVLYKTEAEARKAAARAKRTVLAAPKLPKDNIVRTRVGTPDGKEGFAFAVFLGKSDEKPAAK